MESKALAGVRIAYVNIYLGKLYDDCFQGSQPLNHLWGADVLVARGAEVDSIVPDDADPICRALGRIAKLLRGRLGYLDFDYALIKALTKKTYDLIYVPSGRVIFIQLLKILKIVRTPLIYWEYIPVVPSPAYKLIDLWRKWPFKRGVNGLLCLTKEAVDSYKGVLGLSVTIQQVDWGIDNKLYPGSRETGDFFFSSGRTRRDYKTLFAAAKQVTAKFIVFAGLSQVAGLEIPENVQLLTGDYSLVSLKDLIEKYYAKAIAVIICRLAGDSSNDTSGLTCLLEAMAMCRPVVMTKTGCNIIDIESSGIGKFVPADDVESLVSALREILNQSADERLATGLRGRELVDTYYHSERHGADVADFVVGILSKAQGE